MLFCDFLLVARSGKSHVIISLIGCASHTYSIGPWYWRIWELLVFEYVKTSLDKKKQFRKIKSMQHVLVLVALQQEKWSSYSILIFVSNSLDAPLPWMPGAVAPFNPPLHATGHQHEFIYLNISYVWKIKSWVLSAPPVSCSFKDKSVTLRSQTFVLFSMEEHRLNIFKGPVLLCDERWVSRTDWKQKVGEVWIQIWFCFVYCCSCLSGSRKLNKFLNFLCHVFGECCDKASNWTLYVLSSSSDDDLSASVTSLVDAKSGGEVWVSSKELGSYWEVCCCGNHFNNTLENARSASVVGLFQVLSPLDATWCEGRFASIAAER